MTAAEAALVAAFLTLTGALAVRLLQEKAERRAEFIKELRLRTANAFAEAFVVQHALEWVTWHARYQPESVDAAMKSDYVDAVHRAFPAMLGAMAGTAALSMDVYFGMQPVLSRLYKAEEEVAVAMRFIASSGPPRDEAIEQLSGLHQAALDLLDELPNEISRVMALADRAAG